MALSSSTCTKSKVSLPLWKPTVTFSDEEEAEAGKEWRPHTRAQSLYPTKLLL